MPQAILAALSEHYNYTVPITAGYRKSEYWLRKYSNVVKDYLHNVNWWPVAFGIAELCRK
jgi:hypothetical protein